MSLREQIYINLIYENRWMFLIDGLKMTLFISLFAILLGITLGITLAFFKISKFRVFGCSPLKTIAGVYIDIIRGTPVVTQLLIFYFVIFRTGNPAIVAIIAFGVNSGAYVSEIIRAGILSIDKGQTEAGLSLGFTNTATMRLIVIPQAVKNILPALANEFIVLIKETAAVGYISTVDLTKAGQYIYSRTFSAFVPLISAAILYFIVIKLLSILFAQLETKLRSSDRR